MINTEETLMQLRELKLQGMANSYQGILSLAAHQQPSAHELIAKMVHDEEQSRVDKKTKMYLQLSKLRYDSILEQVHCSAQRNLSKEQLQLLSDCSFITKAENILITGATGCGKSYLACALGRQACCFGFKTLYFGMMRFVEKIQQSKLDGTFAKFLEQLRKIDLIILDDFGLIPLELNVKLSLLQILEDRYEKRATIIVSQLDMENWWEYIADPTIADAIIDRLSVAAHKFFLDGPSLRDKKLKK